VSKGVFHVVSKNVEKKHVSADVENVGVDEHRSEEGVHVFSLKYVCWKHGEVAVERCYKQTHGYVLGE